MLQRVTMVALLMLSSLGHASVSIEQAWIREVPPGSPAAAVFMVIANTGDQPVRVTAITSPAAKRVEWHDMVRDKGMLRMRQRQHIELAANSRTQLKPEGSHLMLLDMDQAPALNSHISVTLHLDNDQVVMTQAVVRKTDFSKSHHHHH